MAKKTPTKVTLPEALWQELAEAAAMGPVPVGISALVVQVLWDHCNKRDQRPDPAFDEVLDPTTRRCVEAMRDIIAQLVKGDGKVGLIRFDDGASAPLEGGFATRKLLVEIVAVAAKR